MMALKISSFLASNRRSFGPMDDWHQCSYFLRRFLRGWSNNHYAESRRDKASLAAPIVVLDARADNLGLSAAEWQSQYSLEEALLGIHRREEVYWKQRGTINWTLKGNSPMAYFFAITNGRRRRCLIDSLLVEGIRISDQSVIMRHVFHFYSTHLSAKPDLGFRLVLSFWSSLEQVSSDENKSLLIPPSEKEIFDAIRYANPNAASGPDGFSIPFFR